MRGEIRKRTRTSGPPSVLALATIRYFFIDPQELYLDRQLSRNLPLRSKTQVLEFNHIIVVMIAAVDHTLSGERLFRYCGAIKGPHPMEHPRPRLIAGVRPGEFQIYRRRFFRQSLDLVSKHVLDSERGDMHLEVFLFGERLEAVHIASAFQVPDDLPTVRLGNAAVATDLRERLRRPRAGAEGVEKVVASVAHDASGNVYGGAERRRCRM